MVKLKFKTPMSREKCPRASLIGTLHIHFSTHGLHWIRYDNIPEEQL